MKALTENQKNRTLKKIERFKKELRYEKTKFGGYHDGRGLRYSIAEMYFELNDFQKTNRYIRWFFKTFPNDANYPHFKIGAGNALFLANKMSESADFIIALNSDNSYILNVITDQPTIDQNKYEPYHFSTLKWAIENTSELKKYASVEFTIWLQEFLNDEMYQKWYRKYISILKLIEDLEVSEERSTLLNEAYKCIEDWKEGKLNVHNINYRSVRNWKFIALKPTTLRILDCC